MFRADIVGKAELAQLSNSMPQIKTSHSHAYESEPQRNRWIVDAQMPIKSRQIRQQQRSISLHLPVAQARHQILCAASFTRHFRILHRKKLGHLWANSEYSAYLAELESAQSVHKTNNSRNQDAVRGVVRYDARDAPVTIGWHIANEGGDGGASACRRKAALMHRCCRELQ